MAKTISLRIGYTQNYAVRAGETLFLELTAKDANKQEIDLTNFTVGPLKIFNYNSDTVLIEIPSNELVISGAVLTIKKLIPLSIRKNIQKGNFYECPVVPPNGGPVAYLDGKIFIDGKQ